AEVKPQVQTDALGLDQGGVHAVGGRAGRQSYQPTPCVHGLAKSEMRSTKSETNPKSKSSNDRNRAARHFGHCFFLPDWNLFRISSFGLRICSSRDRIT